MKRITLIALCAFALFVLPASAAPREVTVTTSPNPLSLHLGSPANYFDVKVCGVTHAVPFRVTNPDGSMENLTLYPAAPGCSTFSWFVYDASPGGDYLFEFLDKKGNVIASATETVIPA